MSFPGRDESYFGPTRDLRASLLVVRGGRPVVLCAYVIGVFSRSSGGCGQVADETGYCAQHAERLALVGWRPAARAAECGSSLLVERYGGGLRHACPVCDADRTGHIPTISWTNAAPPKDRRCHNQRATAMRARPRPSARGRVVTT